MRELKHFAVAAIPVSAFIIAAAFWFWRRIRRPEEFEHVGYVSSLYVFPVKSCAAVSLQEAECTELGFKYDRHWVIYSDSGKYVSLRHEPSLAFVQPHFNDNELCLDAPGMPTLKLDYDLIVGEIRELIILGNAGEGMFAGIEASEWISRYLNRNDCNIYFMADGLRKRYLVNHPEYAGKNVARSGDKTAYANNCPYLVLSQASIDDLNKHLKQPVTALNFRPNIVITGCEPFNEDTWKYLAIGNAQFSALDKCSRCLLITVDPKTGIKDRNYEPHATLHKLRVNEAKQPIFGANFTSDFAGTIHVGDPVFAVKL